MKDTSLRKKEIYTGLFGIVFFFGAFLVGEIGLRVVNEFRFGGNEVLGDTGPDDARQATNSQKTGFYSDSMKLRRPYPDQKLGQVRINNHGFRGPDIPFEKPQGYLRFAFLGSSTSYDAAVPEGKEWPAQVVKIFQNRMQDCKVDFINAGLPGFSTPNMRDYWLTVVNEFKPDIVIVLPGDMTPNLQKAANNAGFAGKNKNNNWLIKNSALWALISKNTEVIRLQRTAFSENEKFQPDKEELTTKFREDLRSTIDSIVGEELFLAVPTIASHVRRALPKQKQLIAADSALFYLPFISIPTLIDLQDTYNDTLRSVVKQYDSVLLIDNDESIPADNQHFVDSRHFAPQGSRAMGERVVTGLLESSQFRDFLSARGICHVPTN